MLATKHFVFVHVPKTGGSFIEELCQEHLPESWMIDPSTFLPEWLRGNRHAGYDAVPEEFASLPAICFVRNPWDWYVSWYLYGKANPDDPWLWETLFDSGRADFDEFLRVACTGQKHRQRVVYPGGKKGPLWLRIMLADQVDFYTALFRSLSGGGVGSGRLEVGRFENLREEFIGFLDRHDVPAPASLIDAIRNEPPRNPANRRPYREYYDDELRELVARGAREIVTKYGYSFT
jgi:hypothetical protein